MPLPKRDASQFLWDVTSFNLVGRYPGFEENNCLHLLLGRADFYPGDSPKMLTFKRTSSITTQKTVIFIFPTTGASNIIRRSPFQHTVHTPFPES
jgi:hypothetical protein